MRLYFSLTIISSPETYPHSLISQNHLRACRACQTNWKTRPVNKRKSALTLLGNLTKSLHLWASANTFKPGCDVNARELSVRSPARQTFGTSRPASVQRSPPRKLQQRLQLEPLAIVCFVTEGDVSPATYSVIGFELTRHFTENIHFPPHFSFSHCT